MNIDSLITKNKIASAELARSVGVSPSVVFQWRKGLRPVPVERCAPIEIATKGAIIRKHLRPDDWADIWPELKEPSHA